MLDVILIVACMFSLLYLKACTQFFSSFALSSIVLRRDISCSRIFEFFFLRRRHISTLVDVTSCGCRERKKRSYNNSLLLLLLSFLVLIFLSAVVLITKRDLNAKEIYSSAAAAFFLRQSFVVVQNYKARFPGSQIKALYLIFTRVFPVYLSLSLPLSSSLVPATLARLAFVWTRIYIKENRSEIPRLRFFCLVLRLILFEFLCSM